MLVRATSIVLPVCDNDVSLQGSAVVQWLSARPCANPESFARGGGGSNSDKRVFFMRGKRIQIALKAGHHRHANEMAFAGVPMMAKH